jgi:hypothetical protein
VNIYWIAVDWPGRLGIAARPRGGDWLDDDVLEWKSAGVSLVVSLLVSDEVRETRALVTELSRAVADGETVVIHCRQGIGRSALVAASVLVALGIDPQHALDSVAEARGRPVLDTPEQRAWVGGDS